MSLSLPLPLPRFDVLRAGRALATLLRDPDDLPQVFTLIDSMSGTAPHRLLFGFQRTEVGKRLLRDRPDILPRLADRAALRALPAGSVGRAYLDFVTSEGITPEGIRDASHESKASAYGTPDIEYLRGRMRDTHDLWHTVAGYRGDVLGELALLAFTLGQHWNSAIAVIVVAGLIKGFGHGETRLVYEGFRRGRAAAWLPAQDWESMLAQPLDDVRGRLGLGAPPEYTPLRSADLRAEGVI
jgi:ubiquinone biosynthesis protein COQ4